MENFFLNFTHFLPLLLILEITLLLATVIALLNSDEINKRGTSKISSLQNRYNKTGWVGKIWFAPSGAYMYAIDAIGDKGWKAGLAYSFNLFKWLIVIAFFWFCYLNIDMLWQEVFLPMLKYLAIIVVIIIVILFFARG
jgi:hypothetical protein